MRHQEWIMCEANAYVWKDGKEELFMEAVDVVDVVEEDGASVRITSIFGEQKIIKGKIRSMSLVNHKILIAD